MRLEGKHWLYLIQPEVLDVMENLGSSFHCRQDFNLLGVYWS